jgi:hypothetical protein
VNAGAESTTDSSSDERPAPADGARNETLVHVYVASFNTASATELCIRTLRSTAGMPFALTVGDAGSEDGSLAMLERFAARGWLELQVATEGRRHAEWLTRWIAECEERYAVFVDSDVMLLRRGWLEQLCDAAQQNDAAFVTADVLHPVHPKVDKDGRQLVWKPRPTPWMLLVDAERARAANTSFGFVARDDDTGKRVMYDTGATFLEAMSQRGENWVVMPDEWSRCFHHFGGLSWLKKRQGMSVRLRTKQQLKRALVWSLLQPVRVRDLVGRRRAH